MLQH